jgi:FKBP-type peptidyl-prolyl cis-trans isomerase (trigger factor)
MADPTSPQPAYQITRLDNGNIDIRLVISWPEIQAAYEKEVQKAIDETELPGFRKGKAPREMVVPKLDHDHLYSHAVQQILPDKYAAAVKGENIKPILYPAVRLEKAEKGQDWIFIAATCEPPVVKIDDYKEIVTRTVKEPKDSFLSRTLEALRQAAKLKLPDMLVEEEANHRIGSLAENLTKLGMTTESYLSTKKITPETLKAQFAGESRQDLENEFILEHIRQQAGLADRAKTLDYLLSLV